MANQVTSQDSTEQQNIVLSYVQRADTANWLTQTIPNK